MSEDQKQAIIYCRLTTVAQALGNGLAMQRARCIAYATAKGYKVVESFCDAAPSDQLERPGMAAMLAFLKRNRHTRFTVLTDDFTRLGRALSVQIELCTAIEQAGGNIDAPGFGLKGEFEFGADNEVKEWEG